MRKNKTILSVFIPYGSGNPYQDKLAESLNQHGVKVEKADTLKNVFRRILFHDYRPDIIHLHWVSAFYWKPVYLGRLVLLILRLSILRMSGFKLVWTVHNIKPHESKSSFLDLFVAKYLAKTVHAVIVHSEYAAQEVISIYNIKNKNKIFVIPHGNYIGQYENNITKVDARDILGIPDSAFIMLFFGSIKPYKGVIELIKAFKELFKDNQNIYLVIAGMPAEQDLSDEIQQLVSQHNNIKYVPQYIPENQIQIYMNSCDICIFPYKNILTSGAVLLAMSFGKACIAPKLGEIPETLDRKGAFLYPPEDKNELIKAIRRAIVSKSKLKQMGEHNRDKAMERDWLVISGKIEEVYSKQL